MAIHSTNGLVSLPMIIPRCSGRGTKLHYSLEDHLIKWLGGGLFVSFTETCIAIVFDVLRLDAGRTCLRIGGDLDVIDSM